MYSVEDTTGSIKLKTLNQHSEEELSTVPHFDLGLFVALICALILVLPRLFSLRVEREKDAFLQTTEKHET